MRIFGLEIKRQKRMSWGSIRELNEVMEDVLVRLKKVEGNRKFKDIKDYQAAQTQDEITDILAQSNTTFNP